MTSALNPDGKLQTLKVDVDGALIVSGGTGGGGGGSGTSNTTEATQLLIKAAVQSLDTKTPALVNTRAPVDTDRVTKQLIDNASGTVTYVCEAATVSTATSAAAWRIKRITVSGNVTTIQWGGTGAFNQIADNRATTVVYA
jgi:chaperonin GroEL (HSP60 family)